MGKILLALTTMLHIGTVRLLNLLITGKPPRLSAKHYVSLTQIAVHGRIVLQKEDQMIQNDVVSRMESLQKILHLHTGQELLKV
jgi:hypothetical protein